MMERNYPFFSVIIPTYNRPEQLAACLDALYMQNYPADRFEVIVVDDGGEIFSTKAVTAVQDTLNVILLKQSHAGPAAARNFGASRAAGAFLAFLDDDCIPDPAWLITLAGYFEKRTEQAVGGRIVNGLQNPFSTISQMILDIAYDYCHGELGKGAFFATCNISVPAKGFGEIGGFDTSFLTSEDREFCYRLQSAGYHLTFAPDALVYHNHCLTLRSFWRQQFSYGRGAFRYQRKRALRGSGYIKPDKRFYAWIVRYVCRLFSTEKWGQATIVTCLLITWQAANALGFAAEAISHLGAKRRNAKDETPRTKA